MRRLVARAEPLLVNAMPAFVNSADIRESESAASATSETCGITRRKICSASISIRMTLPENPCARPPLYKSASEISEPITNTTSDCSISSCTRGITIAEPTHSGCVEGTSPFAFPVSTIGESIAVAILEMSSPVPSAPPPAMIIGRFASASSCAAR